jgi:hypothetical protein
VGGPSDVVTKIFLLDFCKMWSNCEYISHELPTYLDLQVLFEHQSLSLVVGIESWGFP